MVFDIDHRSENNGAESGIDSYKINRHFTFGDKSETEYSEIKKNRPQRAF